MCKYVNNLLKIIKQLITLHISVNPIFHPFLFPDKEVDLPPLTPLTQQDVLLSFPNDSDSKAGNEINTSGIYSGSHDDNFSELLSASQLMHLYKESDYLDPAYIPLRSGLSLVSDDAANTSSSNYAEELKVNQVRTFCLPVLHTMFVSKIQQSLNYTNLRVTWMEGVE